MKKKLKHVLQGQKHNDELALRKCKEFDTLKVTHNIATYSNRPPNQNVICLSWYFNDL